MVKFPIACILFLYALCACGPRGMVPEITPDMFQQRMHLIGASDPISRIAASDNNIIFVSPRNQIIRYDPHTRKYSIIMDLKHQVETDFLFQNNKLILKKAGTNQYMVCDLEQKKSHAISFTSAGYPVGINSGSLVFRHNRDLIIYDFPSLTPRKKINLGKDRLFNCEFISGTIIILTSNKLHIIHIKNHFLKTHQLENEAESGFLLWNNHIYYGSSKRYLIKLSIKDNRIKWKIKLAMVLKEKPVTFKNFLVVTPEDNNILFFKKNGTLHWWEKLGATRKSPALIMNDNVAVFLLNDKIRFFNTEKKTDRVFDLKSMIDSNAVHINKYIYFLSHKKGKEIRFISRIGNQYTVRIKTEPAFVKPLGQSIKFNLTPVNLIKPELRITISNQSKEVIFEKIITHDQMMSFVWIPEQPGTYRLTLDIKARNKKNMSIQKKIKITDGAEIIRVFTSKILRECRSGTRIQPKQQHE